VAATGLVAVGWALWSLWHLPLVRRVAWSRRSTWCHWLILAPVASVGGGGRRASVAIVTLLSGGLRTVHRFAARGGAPVATIAVRWAANRLAIGSSVGVSRLGNFREVVHGTIKLWFAPDAVMNALAGRLATDSERAATDSERAATHKVAPKTAPSEDIAEDALGVGATKTRKTTEAVAEAWSTMANVGQCTGRTSVGRR